MSLENYKNYLIENVGISEDTISCVTSINGYNETTLDDILYYFTGYNSLDQILEEEY